MSSQFWVIVGLFVTVLLWPIFLVWRSSIVSENRGTHHERENDPLVYVGLYLGAAMVSTVLVLSRVLFRDWWRDGIMSLVIFVGAFAYVLAWTLISHIRRTTSKGVGP